MVRESCELRGCHSPSDSGCARFPSCAYGGFVHGHTRNESRWPVHTRRCTCMGASRGFRNRADESDWSNIDVLRELRLRGAIRDVYSCMHSWARKSLVLCFAFGHLGVLFVSVASAISRRAYLIDAPRYFPSFSLRWSLTKQPHRYPSGTISIPISVLFNPLCL